MRTTVVEATVEEATVVGTTVVGTTVVEETVEDVVVTVVGSAKSVCALQLLPADKTNTATSKQTSAIVFLLFTF